MKQAIEKASVLAQALPYIQKYNDKIIVIKYGGNAMTNESLKQNVIQDIVLLSTIGIKVVVVHGGGPNINEALDKMNMESKFIDGLRYTDKQCMQVVQMVLAGQTNKDLVAMLQKANGKAIGLCGIDGGLIKVDKLQSDKDLGYVGKVKGINKQIIFDLLEKGYIPIIASIGCDDNYESYNINADLAAASIAASLQAENMVLVSNIPGLLRDVNDSDSLIQEISLSQLQKLKEDGTIAQGMIPKIKCCEEAIANGVKKVCIIDGRIPHSLLIEILSDDGIGTMITGD